MPQVPGSGASNPGNRRTERATFTPGDCPSRSGTAANTDTDGRIGSGPTQERHQIMNDGEHLKVFLNPLAFFAEPEVNARRMTDTSQKELFGSTFERLGQERRVSVLHAFDLIGQELKSSFDRIRKTRRQYLHFWSKEYGCLSADAVECYRDALRIVAFVPGQTVRDGKLLLDPKLTRYLRALGVFVEPDAT